MPGRHEGRLNFHLLVQVVDNFGDAGVAWRLARGLARDPRHQVDLWIDTPGLLQDLRDTAPLLPSALPPPERAIDQRIRVHRLSQDADRPPASDDEPASTIFLSAFGTPLPAAWRASLAKASHHHPLWVNVEYLSAEDWVEGCHGLASPKPADGAVEHFFYPGFTTATGGLLHEPDLARTRREFLAGPERAAWTSRLGLPTARAGERWVSLFCYPQAPLAPWLDVLQRGTQATRLLACARTAEEALSRWAGRPLDAGECFTRGALTVTRLPWLHPADFDRLLWHCDFNVVRGEDSWVRAQWAARPFTWQAYPQAERAHHAKLEAFLSRVPVGDKGPGQAWRRWNRCWNGVEPCEGEALASVWEELLQALPALGPVWEAWRKDLMAHPDLAAQLVRFCRDRL